MEFVISGVHANMYPIVAPLELRANIALFSPSNLFFTDGSLMDGVAGFAVHHSIDCNVGFPGASEYFHGGACGDPYGNICKYTSFFINHFSKTISSKVTGVEILYLHIFLFIFLLTQH
jgi:hypothetical protein